MFEALIGGLTAGILILLVQDYREWRREKREYVKRGGSMFSRNVGAKTVRDLIKPSVLFCRPFWDVQVRGADVVVLDQSENEVFRVREEDIANGSYKGACADWFAGLSQSDASTCRTNNS